jgi:phytoene synthase
LHEAERGDTVRRIARSGDPDRALAASFAPRAVRPDLLALCAFNVELARIAEQTKEPELGAIRLQWWREAIARARDGEAVGHPVADALGETMRRHVLSAERIAALIDARQFDVATRIMPDWGALETYVNDTAGALFALSAECLGAKALGAKALGATPPDLDRAAEQGGLAYGLTGLMRALPVQAARGRVYLPADMLRSHGTSPEAVLAGSASKGLRGLLAALRDKARGACEDARRHAARLDRPAKSAFLPLALVGPYLDALEALERRGGDPLREIAGINPLYRFWRLARWRP